MSDHVRLQPHNVIIYEGYRRFICATGNGFARCATLDGRALLVKAQLPPVYLAATNGDAEREFQTFASINADKIAQLTAPITPEEIMAHQPQKRVPKGGLYAQSLNNASAPKPEPESPILAANKERYARTGRSSETRRLARETQLTAEEIHAKIKPDYANADLATTKKLVINERSKPQS